MSKYRKGLPQLEDRVFLTDGGIETTLIFKEGFDLPQFAAFHVLKSEKGKAALRSYYHEYIDLARRYGAGFVLESPTWRASEERGSKIGYSPEELARKNSEAIELLREVREENETAEMPVVISGCMGPRGDGYKLSNAMSVGEAERYHLTQIRTLAETDVDMVSAFTMNYAEEATGLALAARTAGIPVVISFTVETDGRLPNGQPLGEAIEQVDDSAEGAPAYYMINCAHPIHFDGVLKIEAAWPKRIRGIRANASAKSHAELDEAEELDEGDPRELGRQYGELRGLLPNLNVLGGCCGTDHRHLEEVCKVVT